MPAKSQSTAIQRLKREFHDLGYVEGLMREDYTFADVLDSNYTTKQIPLAVFAQEPPSYRSAAFGVALANGQSGPELIYGNRSLGAPQILEIEGAYIHRWRVASTETPSRLDTVASEAIPELFARHKEEWSPRSILRAKSSRDSATQLDFLDYDLMPLLDYEVRTKLDRLLKETIESGISTFEKSSVFSEEHYPPLFRLVFRLIAAKVLADRGQSGNWTSSNPQSAIRAVDQFYFGSVKSDEIISDLQTQRVIWDRIRNAFHFQNLSVDSLAYVYENTMVTSDARKSFGIHSTPREIAEYIVNRLPFQKLDEDRRQVFEPFSGHSVFLVAAMQRLRDLLPPEMDPERRHEYFVGMLCGIELDDFAREVAKLSLMLADYPNPDGWRLIGSDAFDSPHFEAELGRASVILCNPPFEKFSLDEQEGYGNVTSGPKPQEILSRVLDQPPALLGFVLPLAFLTGDSYRSLRTKLRNTYSSVEFLVLPDRVFLHSEAETVLLIASGVGSEISTLRTGRVYKKDLPGFYANGRISFGEDILGESARREDYWKPLKLRSLWEETASMRRLGDLVEIHRGIEYRVPLGTHRDHLVARELRAGFSKGVHRVDDSIKPYVIATSVYLNVTSDQLRGGAIKYPWSESKVLVNSARRSRGPWTLTAAVDTEGLTCYQNIHGVWPKVDLPIEVVAAALNGPIANAFVDEFEGKRDVRIRTLMKIPIPEFDKFTVRRITALVQRYIEEQLSQSSQALDEEASLHQSRNTLLLIDALVLRAYNLPRSLERQLLDHFHGHDRIDSVQAEVHGLDQIASADSWLRSSLRLIQGPDPLTRQSAWLDAVSGAVYRYGAIAVDLLRQHWREGLLRGQRLSDTLEELGYVEDPSSHSQRSALLIEALSMPDPDIRYAAAQGLTFLADPGAVNRLLDASEQEKNLMVRGQIEEAIEFSRLTV